MNDQTRLRLIALLNALEEGALDEAHRAELVEMLKASDEAQELYLRFQSLSAGLGEIARQGVLPTDSEPVRLDELARLEDRAEPMTVTMIDTGEWKSRPPSKQQWSAAGRYLFEHYVTPRVIGITAAATALILGVTLALVFLAGETPPPDNDTPTPQEQIVVATITEQQNASWLTGNGEGPLPDRSLLGSRQRLTLTKGSAEITTVRGAKVLLQSPATIETTDSNNAIRLHSGKLVGICETESSKGFVVRTPQLDVIDLGTRFGVHVDESNQTSDVFVFEGSVTASQVGIPSGDEKPMLLTVGQGRRIDSAGQVAVFEPIDAVRTFAQTVDPAQLYESVVIADKPLVYYRMDQLVDGFQRNTAADRYHAEVFGDVSVKREAGRAFLSLDAFGDYLQTQAPIKELRDAGSYTIECWVRPSRHGFGSICSLNVLNKDNPLSLLASARIETTPLTANIGPPKSIRFVHTNATNPATEDVNNRNATDIHTPKPHELDRWMHLAAVKAGPELRLYVDGELVSQGVDSTNHLDIDVYATIGQFSTEEQEKTARNRQFIGAIDELAIYSHALSPDAIRTRYEAGKDWLAE